MNLLGKMARQNIKHFNITDKKVCRISLQEASRGMNALLEAPRRISGWPAFCIFWCVLWGINSFIIYF